MGALGRAGLWMLAAGAALALLEVALLLPRALRLRRRARELALLLRSEAEWLRAWSDRESALKGQARAHAAPLRGLVRVLRHPLAGPLLGYAWRRGRGLL
ncbi:MAG: hypothetical protein ACREPI_04325 [Candidatus Dormibacterales bacterium]